GRQAELGAKGQVARLVEEMRKLSSKTRELEEAARQEAIEQSLRFTQLSILREISRTIVGHLDPQHVTAAITEQLRAALGYDRVDIVPEVPADVDRNDPAVVACVIRDIQGPLGHLVIDNRSARRRLADGTPRHEFQTTATAGQPRPIELAVTLSAQHGRHGTLEGLIAIVRDITAQREVEKQLHQSEKLTALGQLAGGIAHDFNNLLQAILGYAQLMKQNPGNAELMQRSLSVVESAAMDGSETVRRIQQFARLRPDEQFMPVDVNQS